MPGEVNALTEELRGVRGDLHKVLNRLTWLDEQGRQERKRSRWHRLASAVVALAVIAVIVLSVNETREDDRQEFLSCIRSNEARADIRASILETIAVVGGETTDNPEALAPLVEQIQDRLVETIPDRSC